MYNGANTLGVYNERLHENKVAVSKNGKVVA